MATGIVNLYTVVSPPATSGRTAVPQGSSVLRGSGPSRWGHLFWSSLRAFVILDRIEGSSLSGAEVPWGSLVLRGSGPLRWGHPCGSSCAPELVLDRIEGFPEPLLPSSFVMRSPLGVESADLCTYSIGTKVFNLGFYLCRVPSRWGHPFRIEYSVAYILDRIEGISLVSLLVGLLVWVVCSFFGWCRGVCYSPPFPSFFFVCLYSAWLVAWLLRPCLAWHMARDSGLSSPGLICCCAMSPWCFDI